MKMRLDEIKAIENSEEYWANPTLGAILGKEKNKLQIRHWLLLLMN
jgi:hypothetical protein